MRLARFRVVRVLEEREGTVHHFEPGRTVAEYLMELSPDRWGGMAFDVYRGAIDPEYVIPFESLPVDIVQPGEDYIVALRPAALAGLSAAALASSFASVFFQVALSFALQRIFSNTTASNAPAGIDAPEEPTPLNTLSAPRNQPRPGGRVPDIYGKMRHYPDPVFPWIEVWSGRKQTVRALYCVGVGDLAVTDVRVGDTELEQITGAAVTVYPPGEDPPEDYHLVRSSPTFQSVEFEIPRDGGDWSDWHRVPGTAVEELWVDFFLPRGGLQEKFSPHREESYRHSAAVEYRTVNDATGHRGPTNRADWSVSTETRSPRVYTYKITGLAPDGYELRIKRSDNDEQDDNEQLHRALTVSRISSLTKITREQRRQDGDTQILLTLDNDDAGAATSLNARSRFNMLATRKLRVLDAAGLPGSTLEETKRWCDAAFHMLTDPDLCGFSDLEVDGASLVEVQSIMETRAGGGAQDGEYSVVFDAVVDVNTQIQSLGRAARAVLYHDGGTVVAAADRRIDIDSQGNAVGPELQVSGLYNARNRQASDVDAGIAFQSRLPTDPDGVELEWRDASANYRARRLVVPIANGTTPLNPIRERAEGLCNWSQVWRHAQFMANRYLRRRMSTVISGFEDMRFASPFDVIGVVQPWRDTAIEGEIVGWDGGTTITLDFDPEPLPADPHIRLRSTDGRKTDLIPISSGPGANQVTLARAPLVDLETAPEGQLSNLYSISTLADDDADLWVVLGVSGSTYSGEITLANYDPDVFAGDVAELPPPPEPPFDPVQENEVPETFAVFAGSSRPEPDYEDYQEEPDSLIRLSAAEEQSALIVYGANRPDGENPGGIGAIGGVDWYLFSRDNCPRVYHELRIGYDGLEDGDPLPSTCNLIISVETQTIVDWDGDRLWYQELAVERGGSGQLRVRRQGLPGDPLEDMDTPGADQLRVGMVIHVAHDLAGGTYGGCWFGTNGAWHDGGDPATHDNPTIMLSGPNEPWPRHFGLRSFQYVRIEGAAADVGNFHVTGVTSAAQVDAGAYQLPDGFEWASDTTDGYKMNGDMREPNYPGNTPPGTIGFLPPVESHAGLAFDFDIIGDRYRRIEETSGAEGAHNIAIGNIGEIWSRLPAPDTVDFQGKIYFELEIEDFHNPPDVAGVASLEIRLRIEHSGGIVDTRFYRDNPSKVVYVDRRAPHGAGLEDTGFTLNATGDRMICAVDLDANKAWFGVNGSWAFSGDPGADLNPSSALWDAGEESAGHQNWRFRISAKLVDSGNGILYRYGMRAFVHAGQGFVGAIPAGFVAAAEYVPIVNPWPRDSWGFRASDGGADYMDPIHNQLLWESFVSDGSGTGWVRADVGIPPWEQFNSRLWSYTGSVMDFRVKPYFELELHHDGGGATLPDDLELRIQPTLDDQGSAVRTNTIEKIAGQVFRVFRRDPYEVPAGYVNSDVLHGVLWPNPCRLMFAADPDLNRWWLGVDGTWLYSGDPGANLNPTSAFYEGTDIDSATELALRFDVRVGQDNQTNTDYRCRAIIFGEQSGAGAPPSGFEWIGRLTANPKP